MMYSLIYMSVAAKAMQPNEIREIVEESRFNNKLDDITGCLAYIEGHSHCKRYYKFIQVLEGVEHTIASLFQRIQRDRRHHKVTLVVHGPIEARNFDRWEMGLEQIDLDVNPGFMDFFDLDPQVLAGDENINNHMLLDFMKAFYQKL